MPFLWGVSAAAQDPDYSNPETQIEMTGCANLAFEKADADLNAIWSIARAKVKRQDAASPGLTPSNWDLLLDAQRAWLAYRDAACSAESTKARGGTMQSQLYAICLERLTLRRSDDLRAFSSP